MSFLGGVLGASLGTASVAIGVDTRQLGTGLAKARGEIETATSATGKLGSAWKAIGPAVTGAAAAGFAALGVASVKAAVDFENSFTKIAALSNASADDIEKWKGAVLSLAGETTVAPQELADALYFLASAGLEASQILPVLESSAKAAAAGMGTTSDIARLVSAAMNAYGSDVLSAAHATDILAAAIKVGNAEPAEMADVLGQVLPIAQKAGVGFDELAASVASLTGLGVPVDEAATSVKGALTSITAPTKQSTEALAAMGISVSDLQSTLADGGVLAALDLLNTAADGNQQVIKEIIPNVRALTTVYGLTGPRLEAAAAGFDQVTDSQGEAASAFETFINGPGVAFKKLGTDFKVALITIGEALLPVATGLAKVADVLIPLIPLMVKLGALFLAYKTYSFVTTAIQGIATAFVGLNTAVVASVGFLLGVGTALAGIASANPALVASGLTELGDALSGGGLDEGTKQAQAAATAFGQLHDDIAGFSDLPLDVLDAVNTAVGVLTDGLNNYGTSAGEEVSIATEHLNANLKALGSNVVLTEADLRALAAGGSAADEVLQGITASFGDEATAAAKTSGAITAVEAAHNAAADAARAQKSAEDALVGGVLGIVSGMQSLADAQNTVNTLQKQGKRGTSEYKDAVLSVLQQQSSLNQMFTDYAQKLADSGASQKQIRNGLFDLGRQAGLTRGDVQSLAHDALAALASQAGTAKSKVDDLAHSISSLHDKKVNIDIITHYTHTGKLD